jgi:integrase
LCGCYSLLLTAEELKGGLSESFKGLVRKAGLDLQTVQGDSSRQISKRTFHVLGHSFTSGLANAGVSQELRLKRAGHSGERDHRTYSHHDIEILKVAMAKLPSLNS